MAKQLSHVNARGEAMMVDISLKGVTVREAVAKGSVMMQPSTIGTVKNASMKKGDVLAVARVAGIMAAKKSPTLSRSVTLFPSTALRSISTLLPLIASALAAR